MRSCSSGRSEDHAAILPSHIAAVAGGFTELRLSGSVKGMLVEALCAELDRLVPQMEAATLAVDEERKTLDDAAERAELQPHP